jgi:hypothetical protein
MIKSKTIPTRHKISLHCPFWNNSRDLLISTLTACNMPMASLDLISPATIQISVDLEFLSPFTIEIWPNETVETPRAASAQASRLLELQTRPEPQRPPNHPPIPYPEPRGLFQVFPLLPGLIFSGTIGSSAVARNWSIDFLSWTQQIPTVSSTNNVSSINCMPLVSSTVPPKSAKSRTNSLSVRFVVDVSL